MIRLKTFNGNNVNESDKIDTNEVNEDLISDKEIPFTYVHGDMIYIYNQHNFDENKLTEGYSSATADKMTEEEIKDLIWNIK